MRLSFLISLLICSLGLFALSRMPREIDPEDVHHVERIVSYLPGASPERLDDLITRPVERVLNSISNIGDVATKTTDGISVVTFETLKKSDRESTLGVIRDRLHQLRSALKIEAPFLIGPELSAETGQVDSGLILVTGDDDLGATREYAAQLVSKLRSNPAIASAEISFDQPHTAVVKYSDEDLARAGLTPTQLAEFIRTSAQLFPGGFLESDENFFSINIGRGISNLETLQDLPVRDPRDGSVTLLGDICEITIEPWKSSLGSVYMDETPAVGITFAKATSATWEASKSAIESVLSEKREALSSHLFYYRGDTTDSLVGSASRTVIFSVLVVLFCVTLGLGLRAGFAASVAVATTLLGTVFLLFLIGIELNVVTLAALAVGTGLLIDNHIVIAHHVGLPSTAKSMIDPRLRCWRDLATPLIIAAATTALGFLPAWLIRNEAAGYISSIFIVIGTLLLVSQFVGFVVTPVLAAKASRKVTALSLIGTRIERVASRLLNFPRVSMIIAAGAAFLGLFFLHRSEDKPLASIPTEYLSIDLILPPGTSPDSTANAATKLRAALKNITPTVTATFLNRPGPQIYRGARETTPSSNRVQLLLKFTSPVNVPTLTADSLASDIPDGASVRIHRVSATPVGSEPVAIRIFGSPTEIHKFTTEHEEYSKIDEGTLVEEIAVTPDLEIAAAQKITTSEIALGTMAVTGGIPVGFLPHANDNGNRTPILLKVASDETDFQSLLEEAYVHRQSGGDPVPLEEVADISRKKRPVAISRWNGTNVGYLTPAPKSNPVTEEQALVSALQVQANGLNFEAAGEWAQSERTEGQILRHIMPISIGILLLLLIQTRSAGSVFIILLAIMPSLFGAGLVSFLYTGFGMMQLLGIVALAGIVVNNAIVLVDRLGAAQASTDAQILTVTRTRFVPISLSAICAIFGLLPLTISGNPLWLPFATVMIAGLLFSTVTTITFVPALWKLVKLRNFAK